ncbi:MAG: PAS domain S-box protein [Deltaproteobacteria bacterium]|nr:PAS domain S-box protein [Deltaproteobacteria bacterium]
MSLTVILAFRRQVTLKTTALFDKNEELTVEIEQRSQVEQALRGSEEKYRLLVENAKDAIFITQDGVLKFVNPNTLKFVGYSEKKLLETPFINFIHPEDRQVILERYNQRIRGEDVSASISFRVISRTGKELFVDLNAALITWEGKPAILNFLRDITSQKEMEAQLQHARKMETIGTLAGGVAHDLNNILSGVVSYPELLLLNMPLDSPYRKPLLTIQKSGEKAAAIVQDLLTLARRGVFVSEVVNLNQTVSESLQTPELDKIIQYHPKTRIAVRLDDNLLNIKGSTVHLSKTIFNLVSNAAEAMPHGGEIVISTANQYVDRPVKGYDEIKQGDYVVLRVADTGVGIAAEDLEKIFEPFFTKKKMGRSGTGLGMAVVWGTVKDHKGYIDIDSQQERGTTFSLYFPVTRQQAAAAPLPAELEGFKGDGETILVVDDVDEQREIASAILTQLGYRVTTLNSGEAAVTYLESNHADLVVLDMIMPPGIDGLETYQQIVALKNNQKTVIASGYSETDRVKAMQKLGAGAYVKKPYTLEKIGLAVKSELDKSEQN